jgi:hypothetical protein
MIKSLAEIVESTDALSKGLLGFKMNINQNLNDSGWDSDLYTYPDKDEKKPYTEPWIQLFGDIQIGTHDTGELKAPADCPSPHSTPRGDGGHCASDYTDWEVTFNCGHNGAVSQSFWCNNEKEGQWSLGFMGTAPKGTCAQDGWGSNTPFVISDSEGLQCQYIDAMSGVGGMDWTPRGCLDCKDTQNTCSTARDNNCFPYAVGFDMRNYQNAFHGGDMGPNTGEICGVATETYQYWGQIASENWVLGGKDLPGKFLGSRTISGDGLPVYNTDYLLAQCNRKYFINENRKENSCKGGYCDMGDNYSGTDQTEATMAKKDGWVPKFNGCTETGCMKTKQPGWLRGEWTFPITTQSTQPATSSCIDNNECTSGQFCYTDVCYTQDTLGYVASQGPGKCVINTNWTKTSVQLDDKKGPLTSPTLVTNAYTGIGPWLEDMLNTTGTLSDPKTGFLRDYVIIRSFASAYCATLYGYADTSANKCRENWSEDGINDFQPIWNAEGLLGKNNVFGEQLYDQLKDSFQIDPKTNQIPFFTELGDLTQKPGEVFTSSSTASTGLSITLPVDGFRMNEILNPSRNGIDTTQFQSKILTPLIGRGKISQPSSGGGPEDENDYAIGSNFTIKYKGIGYTKDTPFATTMQTSSDDYSTRISNTITPSNIDSGILWPTSTHAWILKDGSVGGSSKVMIEALYYVTVDIEKWNPALALLYLSTVKLAGDAPLGVLSRIQKDTGLVPINYLKQICKEGNCLETIKNNCARAYSNTYTPIQPNVYFLLYNASTVSLCSCIASGLVPSNLSPYNNPAAQCFDQSCGSNVPGTTKTLSELLGLTDNVCESECDTMKSYQDDLPRNQNALNPEKFQRLCGGEGFDNSSFNIGFFIKLLVPTVILTTTILLFGGINTPSIIIASLALLTLTGGAYYLARVFTPFTQCGDVSVGGAMPLCVSKYNRQMEIHPSFCNLNMFCECIMNNHCGEDCTCKGGVCLSKNTKQRNSYEKPVKMINLPMVILSSALIILVPILIFGLRKRFFPNIPNIIFVGLLFLSVSIIGTTLVLSLFSYSNPRVEYVKQSCGPTPSPSPSPSPQSISKLSQ